MSVASHRNLRQHRSANHQPFARTSSEEYSMRHLLLAASMLCALALPAKAEFVLNDFTVADLGATEFGNAPRLLTLQNAPFDNGAVVSNGGATQFLNNITIGPAPAFSVTG